MKRSLIALALLSPAVSMACGELSDYDVNGISFSRTPAKEAITKVTDSMPFQIVFNGRSDKVVSADNVSGPLDKVLEALGGQLGVTYKKDRCVLTFTPKVDTTLNIKTDDLLSATLSTWAKVYGYSMVWEAGEYRATAPLSLDKGFNETIDAVMGALRINGIALDVTIYQNNVIRVTEAK